MDNIRIWNSHLVKPSIIDNHPIATVLLVDKKGRRSVRRITGSDPSRRSVPIYHLLEGFHLSRIPSHREEPSEDEILLEARP